jgi:hypothetical protein
MLLCCSNGPTGFERVACEVYQLQDDERLAPMKVTCVN